MRCYVQCVNVATYLHCVLFVTLGSQVASFSIGTINIAALLERCDFITQYVPQAVVVAIERQLAAVEPLVRALPDSLQLVLVLRTQLLIRLLAHQRTRLQHVLLHCTYLPNQLRPLDMIYAVLVQVAP